MSYGKDERHITQACLGIAHTNLRAYQSGSQAAGGVGPPTGTHPSKPSRSIQNCTLPLLVDTIRDFFMATPEGVELNELTFELLG